MDIVIMVTLSQCIIFGSHIPQGAPSSDSMSADLRNKRRNNPAEEFGEEEQEKNTFILIGMETPVRIECIIVIISYYVWSADMLAYSCNISLLYLLSLSNF
uniref:Uncharacterized protein n=1 Tax=Aegilops tauschii subsp. strangulata TaxID=200361 RepID=A0A452Y3B3_AEGTS